MRSTTCSRRFPPLLRRFVERFSLSNTAAGPLSTFPQIPSLLQPIIGHLADRKSLRWIVVLGPAVTATRAVGDILGLATAMTIAACGTFCGVPLIWMLFRRTTSDRNGPADQRL